MTHSWRAPARHGSPVRLPDGKRAGWAPSPYLVLEIADCTRRINLEFDIAEAEDRLNSFHKIDTLITARVAFRDGMAAEAALRRRRLRQIDAARRDGAAMPTAALGLQGTPAFAGA